MVKKPDPTDVLRVFEGVKYMPVFGGKNQVFPFFYSDCPAIKFNIPEQGFLSALGHFASPVRIKILGAIG